MELYTKNEDGEYVKLEPQPSESMKNIMAAYDHLTLVKKIGHAEAVDLMKLMVEDKRGSGPTSW